MALHRSYGFAAASGVPIRMRLADQPWLAARSRHRDPNSTGTARCSCPFNQASESKRCETLLIGGVWLSSRPTPPRHMRPPRRAGAARRCRSTGATRSGGALCAGLAAAPHDADCAISAHSFQEQSDEQNSAGSEVHPQSRVAQTVTDGSVEIGISDHAQEELGDLVFIELPQVGRRLAAGEACAVIESVKAASDIFAPIAGTVMATNDQLAQSPELVNHDPYGGGWLMRLKPMRPPQPSRCYPHRTIPASRGGLMHCKRARIAEPARLGLGPRAPVHLCWLGPIKLTKAEDKKTFSACGRSVKRNLLERQCAPKRSSYAPNTLPVRRWDDARCTRARSSLWWWFAGRGEPFPPPPGQ